jgi:hypothetical protein
MKPLRHLGFLLCLAFALAIGQQGALLHALGHATEQVQHKGDPKPAKVACETCAMVAQPSGMPVSGLLPLALVEGHVDAVPFAQAPAPARVTVVFRSRAPPVLL